MSYMSSVVSDVDNFLDRFYLVFVVVQIFYLHFVYEINV